jgi:MFS family permease
VIPAPHPGPSGNPWPRVLFVVACGVLAAFHVGKVPPALPLLRDELGMSLWLGSWVVSIFNLVAALCGVLVGLVADIKGARKLATFGLLTIAASSLAGAAAVQPGWLLATRAAEGLGFLVVAAGLPTLLTRIVAGPSRGFAMGLWGSFMPLGIGSSLLLSPLIIEASGWRMLWIVYGLLLVPVALLFPRVIPPRTPQALTPRFNFAALRAVVVAPGPLLLGTCFGLTAAQMAPTVAFLPLWLVEHRGMALVQAAPLVAGTVLFSIVGTATGGWLCRHGYAPWKLVLAGAAIMALTCLPIFVEAFPDTLRIIDFAIFNAGAGMIVTCIYETVPRLAPAASLIGASNGVVAQLNNLSQLFAPPLVAALVLAVGGWHMTPLPLLACSLGVAACALGMRALAGRQGQAPAAPG